MNKKLSKNKEKILNFILSKKRYVSIEEICKELKMSRPTVSKYINELIKENWLEEE